MQIRVAVENGNDGRSLAWALDYPGCFVYGPDESTVILVLPEAYLHYAEWISSHTPDSWVKTGQIDLRLVEVWQCYFINNGYQIRDDGIEVNAWFRDDWRPLSKIDVTRGKQLLKWNREDLYKVIQPLTADQLEFHSPGEAQWTIRKILRHIANAEWWYLDRLELVTWKKNDLPEDPFVCLEFIRAQVISILNDLPGLEIVRGKDGEFWSPRKLLRRLLYHERDHLDHILQILAGPL